MISIGRNVSVRRANNLCWKCQGRGYSKRYGLQCDACGGTGYYRRPSKTAIKAQLDLLGIDPKKEQPKAPSSPVPERILKICNADVKERDLERDPYTDPLYPLGNNNDDN
jgi:hypothetical protein